MSRSAPESDLKPWDPRPWPARGDDSIEVLYAAAGRALSQWERYEGALSLLFSALVSTALTQAARRAFRAVKTFEGRIDMLRGAAEGYFTENPDSGLLTQFRDILQSATNFAPRRADIAHGVVDHFVSHPAGSTLPEDATYCLYPPRASSGESHHNDPPRYCFSSVELDYFFSEFYLLQEPAAAVAARIIKKGHRQRPRSSSHKDLHPYSTITAGGKRCH